MDCADAQFRVIVFDCRNHWSFPSVFSEFGTFKFRGHSLDIVRCVFCGGSRDLIPTIKTSVCLFADVRLV